MLGCYYFHNNFSHTFQVASRALNIPISKIHISETATNLVPNASPTAASMGSDLYGMAVLVSDLPPSSCMYLPCNYSVKN